MFFLIVLPYDFLILFLSATIPTLLPAKPVLDLNGAPPDHPPPHALVSREILEWYGDSVMLGGFWNGKEILGFWENLEW